MYLPTYFVRKNDEKKICYFKFRSETTEVTGRTSFIEVKRSSCVKRIFDNIANYFDYVHSYLHAIYYHRKANFAFAWWPQHKSKFTIASKLSICLNSTLTHTTRIECQNTVFSFLVCVRF